MIARSADAVTPVVTDEELLATFGSAVVDATDAVFVSEPACAGAVTVTVITGAVAPVPRAARVQVTETLPVFEHTHPVPVADTNVTPAGNVSVTVRFAASDGPLLTTVSEYATEPPATTVGGPSLVIARSALAVTVVTTVELLLPGTGSAVVEATDAVFDNDPAWFGAVTVTVITGAVAPVASNARVQVTDTLPAFAAHPPGARRGHERHPRRQRVRHRQVRRVRRAGVRHRQAVRDRARRHHRRRSSLRDRQVRQGRDAGGRRGGVVGQRSGRTWPPTRPPCRSATPPGRAP